MSVACWGQAPKAPDEKQIRHIFNNDYGQRLLFFKPFEFPQEVVWDKSANIEFIRPGTGTVSAHFSISPEQISEIRQQTASGEKFLPKFVVNIVDENGQLVARATKTLYIRKKPQKR